MSSLISIFDGTTAYHSTNTNFKVIVTDHNDESVSFSGYDAVSYLLGTVFSGFSGSVLDGRNSGVLPPGVRMIDSNYVLFERPPCYQNIFYNTDKVHSKMSDSTMHVYRIPLPWQIYVARFDSNYYLTDVNMFFSSGSLTEETQQLCLPPLPNFYTNGQLCRPFFAEMQDVERYQKNISGVIASAYDWVWNNGTNNDLNEAVAHVNLQSVYPKLESSGFNLDSYAGAIKDTVFKHVSYEDYVNMFANPYNVVYYAAPQVMTILSAWEKIPLEEILSVVWPASSVEQHFPSIAYKASASLDELYEHPSYYDWLNDWAHDYYEGEDPEDIASLIENGDYNGDAYYEYVVNSNKISIKPYIFKYLTCADILRNISSESSTLVAIKSRYNSFVSAAFIQKAQKSKKTEV